MLTASDTSGYFCGRYQDPAHLARSRLKALDQSNECAAKYPCNCWFSEWVCVCVTAPDTMRTSSQAPGKCDCIIHLHPCSSTELTAAYRFVSDELAALRNIWMFNKQYSKLYRGIVQYSLYSRRARGPG